MSLPGRLRPASCGGTGEGGEGLGLGLAPAVKRGAPGQPRLRMMDWDAAACGKRELRRPVELEVREYSGALVALNAGMASNTVPRATTIA
jgi:hypothetical protein